MTQLLTDEQLVANYMLGDEQSFEILCHRYDRLIKSLSRTVVLFGGSDEDLWQEGFLGLLSACKNYDKSRADASSFMTYAYSCIKNKMLMAVKKEKTDKQIALSNSVPLESLPVDDTIISPEDVIIDNEFIIEIKRKILSKLSKFEEKVFELYLEGYNYLEIAEKLSKSAKSIDNALHRIKEKCKQ